MLERVRMFIRHPGPYPEPMNMTLEAYPDKEGWISVKVQVPKQVHEFLERHECDLPRYYETALLRVIGADLECDTSFLSKAESKPFMNMSKFLIDLKNKINKGHSIE